MSLMSKLFGNGKLAGGTGNIEGSHSINKGSALSPTDAAAVTPNNADFSSIRSAPVLQKPRYFSATEAGALTNLAKQKREMLDHTHKAYKALKTVDSCDTEVHGLHRRYQTKVARNELKKLQANTQMAEALHSLRPEYHRLGQRVEVADKNASDAINAIKQSYGG